MPSESAEEALSRAEAAAAEARARAEVLAKQARTRADEFAKEARSRADDLAKEVRTQGRRRLGCGPQDDHEETGRRRQLGVLSHWISPEGFDRHEAEPFFCPTGVARLRDSSRPRDSMRQDPLRRLLRFFFDQLYHCFAWSYDLVAAAVSLGRWREWVQASLPFIRGSRVLELAFGTGMLQQSLLADERRMVAGIDESAQMVETGQAPPVSRGLALGEPHPGTCARGCRMQTTCFDSVVSTFPNEFIVDPETLAEVRRVLRPGGRLIVVPVAWIIGDTAHRPGRSLAVQDDASIA